MRFSNVGYAQGDYKVLRVLFVRGEYQSFVSGLSGVR